MAPESFFSYNVSRPFPFRWFTPVAIVGGIVSIVLFTFLNFASASYELIIQNVLNPNETVSDHSINYPSFLATKIRPTCQPASLPVSSEFFTNQTALKYTLTGVWQQDDSGVERIISPSLVYHNNILRHCSINSVGMDFSSLDRKGNQFAFSEWGLEVRTYVTCAIDSPTGTVLFNLTQTYDYIPDTMSFAYIHQYLGTGFLSHNQTTHASLWWGESLMSTYWGSLVWLMVRERENDTNEGNSGLRKGTISLVANESISDIQDSGFFNLDYRFMIDRGGGLFDTVWYRNEDRPSPFTLGVVAEEEVHPNIWTDVDLLAKAVYSTVLTDLGQTEARPNILADEALLTLFTEGLANKSMSNFFSGPANDSYSILKDTTGPLDITPSVISTTYICQVPRLKSAGSLFIAILIADLVLLQAVWQLYKLVAEAILARQQPSANCCQGCLRASAGQQLDDTSAPLVSRSASGSKYHSLGELPITDHDGPTTPQALTA